MSDSIRYVIRFFSSDDSYLYSVHVSADILDEILEDAKKSDMKFKILAYRSDSSESEV